MKEYLSIDRNIRFGDTVYAFDKYDGSNIRAEWTKKNKFNKFGTRRQLISKAVIRKGEILQDGDRGLWGEAVRLVQEKYEKDLHDIFVKNRFMKVTCFFEFWGKNSFAGRHFDEKHDVTLIDVSIHKRGYLLPSGYLKMFDKLDIAKLLYYGNANHLFVDEVRESRLNGMTYEGIVCKMPEYKTPGVPWMFKVKSFAWLDRLKKYCNGDEKRFKELM